MAQQIAAHLIAAHLRRDQARNYEAMQKRLRVGLTIVWLGTATNALAQTASVAGAVRDETGGALPGVSVELRGASGSPMLAVTDSQGSFRLGRVAPARYYVALRGLGIDGPLQAGVHQSRVPGEAEGLPAERHRITAPL